MEILTVFQQKSDKILILRTSFLCIMNSKKEKLKGKVEHRSLLPCCGNTKVYTDMNKPLQYLQLIGNDGQE